MGILGEGNQSLEELEAKKEMAKARTEIAEQKALEAEAKRRYGTDWKKFFSAGGDGGFKSGIDWQAIKFRTK